MAACAAAVLAATMATGAMAQPAGAASPPTPQDCPNSEFAVHHHVSVRAGDPGPRPSTPGGIVGWLPLVRSVGHAQYLARTQFGQQIDVDCIFGGATDRAIRNIQGFCRQATGRRDIAVDGIVGAVTWRILDAGSCYA